ncbi:MAG: hypothetical protein M1497_08730 [Nitrospirae bacterium]|nr:hypothetical protein [Nitrospirota bacterium]
MKDTLKVFMAAICLFLFSGGKCLSATSGEIDKADRLGEEFQRQMPYSKERPETGETPGQTQPGDYTAPSEREGTLAPAQPGGYDEPLCYDPYTGTYEYCYPEDSDYFRSRFQSPGFPFWWERGRSCPPGYHFEPGRGCYRH